MSVFEYKLGELCAERIAVRQLVERYGTPLYVYSRAHFTAQYRTLQHALSDVNPLICFSVKANSNLSVIRTFADLGAGADIVSGGELYRVLQAGLDPAKTVFAGVGKTRDEIEFALRENILFFTVESEAEALRISECARTIGTTARIAFRVNPDVDPDTHLYVSTGRKEAKFGLDIERALSACEQAARLPNIELAGIHMHIGSQILSPDPFAAALERVVPLCKRLQSLYPSLRYLDIGGGIGISYQAEQAPLDPVRYARAVLPLLKELRLSVVLEPGRFLVGNGGLLVCRVEHIKDNAFRKFVIIDAGMNDLIRPALYEAHHDVLPVRYTERTFRADLVGPICETGDFIALDRDLPWVEEGDLLAIASAGAYGFCMSSHYNSRPRAAEVMVHGTRARLVRKREGFKDLVRGERRPQQRTRQ